MLTLVAFCRPVWTSSHALNQCLWIGLSGLSFCLIHFTNGLEIHWGKNEGLFQAPNQETTLPPPPSKGHLSTAQGFDPFSVFKCSLLPGGELRDSASIDIMSPLNPYVNRMSNTFTTQAKQVSSWSWQDKYFGPAPAGAMPVCTWAFCLAQAGPWNWGLVTTSDSPEYLKDSMISIRRKMLLHLPGDWFFFFLQPRRKFLNIYPEKGRQLPFFIAIAVYGT